MDRQKGLAPLLIVILIALSVGGYLVYQKQKPVSLPQPTTQPSSTSVASPAASNQNQTKFVPGEVIVGIKSGVRYGDAEQLIKSYNLKYKGDEKIDLENKKVIPYDLEDIVGERPVWIIVFVPVGEENKWVKIFESASIVKYASLNGYLYIQNK